MLRGEVRLTDLDPVRGSEAAKRRPAVLVSNDHANATAARLGRGVVTLVPLTSNTTRVLPFQVLLPAQETGLRLDSKAQAEQVRSVAVERIGPLLGVVPTGLMRNVDDALRLHLHCDASTATHATPAVPRADVRRPRPTRGRPRRSGPAPPRAVGRGDPRGVVSSPSSAPTTWPPRGSRVRSGSSWSGGSMPTAARRCSSVLISAELAQRGHCRGSPREVGEPRVGVASSPRSAGARPPNVVSQGKRATTQP